MLLTDYNKGIWKLKACYFAGKGLKETRPTPLISPPHTCLDQTLGEKCTVSRAALNYSSAYHHIPYVVSSPLDLLMRLYKPNTDILTEIVLPLSVAHSPLASSLNDQVSESPIPNASISFYSTCGDCSCCVAVMLARYSLHRA